MVQKNILQPTPLQPRPPLPDGGRAMGEGTGVRFRAGGHPYFVTVTDPASQVIPEIVVPVELSAELRAKAKLPEPAATAVNSSVSTTPEPLAPGVAPRWVPPTIRVPGVEATACTAPLLSSGPAVARTNWSWVAG